MPLSLWIYNGLDDNGHICDRVRMTATFDSISAYVYGAKAGLAEKREMTRVELERMSQAMIDERGLLNHAQAAELLGVSVKRIGELVRQGKLRRFDFTERTYVSYAQVMERYKAEIAAGERLKESLPKRVLVSIKGAIKTDEAQWKLGGYAGAYHEDRRQKKMTARLEREAETARKAEEFSAEVKRKTGEFVKKLLDPHEVPKKKTKK
jgi:hypothetical protein